MPEGAEEASIPGPDEVAVNTLGRPDLAKKIYGGES